MSDLYIADLVDSEVVAAVAILRTDSLDIQVATPDYVGKSCDGRGSDLVEGGVAAGNVPLPVQRAAATTLPNDPLFGDQWGLRNIGQLSPGGPAPDIRAFTAWDVTTGGSGSVQVGILSTGIDATHPDLQFVTPGPNFVSGSGSSSDDDALSGGTATAGAVGAKGNNGAGVAGVSWGPALVAVKVLDANGQTFESAFLQGVDWARQHLLPIVVPDVQFINQSDNMAATFKNAHASGMLLAAPVGNNDANVQRWPASYLRLAEGVGAIAENGARWRNATDLRCPTGEGLGSPFGVQVDLVGPGGNRIVTTRRVSAGTYYGLSPDVCRIAWRAGTTGAAAFVAGTAALLRSYSLVLYGEDMAQILERTSRDLGPVGRDDEFGIGCVTADAALGFINNASAVEQGSTSSTTDLGEVDNPEIRFHDVPPPADGQIVYCTKKHEIRANVQFTYPFVSPPTVWGRNAQSVGWRSHPNGDQRFHLEEPAGWCEVVPGSITRTGCTIRTFIYEVFTCLGAPRGWYPAAPGQVTLAYTAVGPANATAVPVSDAPRVLSVVASPNPVAGKGEFRVTLPTESHVTLRLYRLDGSLARELARGAYPRGVHRIPWNTLDPSGGRLPAGVYFYRLTTKFRELSGKLLVVR